MMGRIHALTGFALGMGVGAAAGGSLGSALLFGCLCGGATTQPDIDHPDSSVSNTFGPVTRRLAWVVGRLSGGHRNGTHSATGASIFALIAFAATALHLSSPQMALHGLLAVAILMATAIPVRLRYGPAGKPYKTKWGAPVVIGVLGFVAVAAALGAVHFGRIVGTLTLAILMILALSSFARAMRIPGKVDDYLAIFIVPFIFAPGMLGKAAPVIAGMDFVLVPWVLVAGIVLHVIGDAITIQGVPWAWPMSQRNVGPKLILTDGLVERRVITPAFTVFSGVPVAYLSGWGAGAAFGALLGWMLYKGSTGKPKRRKRVRAKVR